MARPAPGAGTANRISPVRFVVGFGVVSALADVVYEGARSVIGPYLGTLGATAAVVGLLTGAGEAAALVLRLVTGRLADRTGRPWPQTIAGYLITALCAPLLAVGGNLAAAGLLYNGERVGKAVRTPARDIMLAHASAELGRGYAFGLHEALDQVGGMTGPLLIAAILALGGNYRLSFALLAIPGALALLALTRLRAAAPDPLDWEPAARVAERKDLRLERGAAQAVLAIRGVLGHHHAGLLHLGGAGLPNDQPAPGPAVAGAGAVRAGDGSGLAGRRRLRQDLMTGSGCADCSRCRSWPPPCRCCPSPPPHRCSWPAPRSGGAGMGVHDSTMRAAVADLVPAHRRGAGYGTFTAVYGMAWLAGAALIGWLYEHGTTVVALFILAVQAVALALLVALLRDGARRSRVPA